MGFSKFLGDIAKNTVGNLLGGGPDNVGNSNPKALSKGVVQDWTHATKVFVGSDLLRAPKYKGMFHVSFVFNSDALNKAGGSTLLQVVPRDVLSVLTKSIELPKFTMEYSTLNSYNHTTYNYKKIKYEPITVTFHDDMADLVQTFWYFYYAYYFADGSKKYNRGGSAAAGGGGFFQGLIKQGLDMLKNKVASGIKKLFGKGGDSSGTGGEKPKEESKDAYEAFRKFANGVLHGDKGSKDIADRHYTWGLNGSAYHLTGGDNGAGIPLLQAIEIYPLGNKKASMIVLHNPRIVAWSHDTFDYSATGTATCQATIVYEGVTYNDQIDAKTVLDDVAMYDRHGAPGTKKKGGGIFSFIDKVDGILGKMDRGEKLTMGDVITGATAAKSLFKGGG